MFGNIRGKVKTWLTAGAGTIAAVLIAGLLGAFGALPEPPVQEFPKRIAIEAGQWEIMPVRAYGGHERVYDLPLKDGMKAVLLEVDMTNHTAESTRDYFKVFEISGSLKGQVEDLFIALVRDATMSPKLHPGLAERVVFYWQTPVSTPVPDRLTFIVKAQTYKQRDNLYGAPGWFNRREIGRITLLVETTKTAAGNQ